MNAYAPSKYRISHGVVPWRILAGRAALAGYLFGLCAPLLVRADTGLVVYGSKGMDQRRTDSGHVSLIVTDLCASGIDQVRRCSADERPGVVVTAYSNLATDYNKAVFVVPLLDHFAATNDSSLIPVLSSGASLRAAQIRYWREHLRPYFPPIAEERYKEIRDAMDQFDAGRTVRRFLTMEFIGSVLGSHKHQDPTEPMAIIDPATQELIPDGRWREAIGTEQLRSAVIVTAPASIAQELRLVKYLKQPQTKSFNVMSGNCSDFVEGALLAVYSDSGLRFRPRALDIADAWVTSPLVVATGFVSYAQKNAIPLRVEFLPITAGTRRSHFAVHSLSRGALVPDPSQGKMAFALKTYFNFLNPLLGLTSFTVDQFSGFVNLPSLIHDCTEGDLSSVGVGTGACSFKAIDWRDRVRVFGTTSCWRKKRDEFQKLASQAVEVGVLNRAEEKMMLKQAQPFLLPRLYEQAAADHSPSNQSPSSDIQSCLLVGCSRGPSLVDVSLSLQSNQERAVPGRAEIRLMAESADETPRQAAFKLMAAVINFDLSSEPPERRNVQAFDKDWQLLLHLAEKNNLTGPSTVAEETLERCSCNSFDQGAEDRDALQASRSFLQKLMRAERQLVTGPTR